MKFVELSGTGNERDLLDEMKYALQSADKQEVLRIAPKLFYHGTDKDVFVAVERFEPYLASSLPFSDEKLMQICRAEMEADTAQARKPFIDRYVAEMWLRGISKKQFLASVPVQDPATDPSYNVHTLAA